MHGRSAQRSRSPNLIEKVKWRVAGVGKVSVLGGAFLLAMARADARIHIEHDATHLASRPHRKSTDQSPTAVGVFVSDKLAGHGLALHARQIMPAPFRPVHPSIARHSERRIRPRASEVTLGPWNASLRQRSKSRRRTSDWASPAGGIIFAIGSIKERAETYGSVRLNAGLCSGSSGKCRSIYFCVSAPSTMSCR